MVEFDLSKMDFSKVMDMAQQFKQRMSEMEESLARIQVESVVGGGMVTVKANAKGEIVSIVIDPELLAMNDKDMTENLVTAGVNQALNQARSRREQEMQKMAGGLMIPGMFA